jgi:hypothetical protein
VRFSTVECEFLTHRGISHVNTIELDECLQERFNTLSNRIFPKTGIKSLFVLKAVACDCWATA